MGPPGVYPYRTPAPLPEDPAEPKPSFLRRYPALIGIPTMVGALVLLRIIGQLGAKHLMPKDMFEKTSLLSTGEVEKFFLFTLQGVANVIGLALVFGLGLALYMAAGLVGEMILLSWKDKK